MANPVAHPIAFVPPPAASAADENQLGDLTKELPQELIFHILEFLPMAKLVKFQEVNRTGRRFAHDILDRLHPNFPEYKVGDDTTAKGLTPESLKNVQTKYGSHLRAVIIYRSAITIPSITDAHLLEMIKSSPHLQKLELGNLSSITYEGFIALFQNATGLQSLTIATKYWSNELVQAAVENLPSLKELTLAGQVGASLTDAALDTIGNSALKLRSLKVQVSVIKGIPLPFTQQKVIELLRKKPNLVGFALNSCTGVNDNLLTAVAATSPDIVSLNVGAQSDFSILGMAALAAGCTKLTHLTLSATLRANEIYGYVTSKPSPMKLISHSLKAPQP